MKKILGLTRQHQLHITRFKDDYYKIADINLAVQKFKPLLTIIEFENHLKNPRRKSAFPLKRKFQSNILEGKTVYASFETLS